MPRIHITGASGSGTTTLGAALAQQLSLPHFDGDDYYWLPTDPPYTSKRDKAERNRLLLADQLDHHKCVLSGSMTGWGTGAEQHFDLVVFLFVPTELRLARLSARERVTFGAAAIEPGGAVYDNFREFMDWAARYDTAGMEQRSLVLHQAWLDTLSCPVLRIEGDTTEEVYHPRRTMQGANTFAIPLRTSVTGP